MSVYRRCGCLDADGKQYGAKCPKLATDPKHGTWAYQFNAGTELNGKTGKPKRRQIADGGFPTRRAALNAEAEARDKVAKGRYVEPSKLTPADYAREWLVRRRTTGSA